MTGRARKMQSDSQAAEPQGAEAVQPLDKQALLNHRLDDAPCAAPCCGRNAPFRLPLGAPRRFQRDLLTVDDVPPRLQRKSIIWGYRRDGAQTCT